MVANDPWQKIGTPAVTPADDRLAMVEAAVGDVDGLEVSDLEIGAAAISYTADTLAELAAEDPERELFLILGSDAAAGLPTWERVDEVRSLATIVVVDPSRRGGGQPARRVELGAGRDAAPRGLEHRPPGPGGRRSAARLPADAGRHRLHREPGLYR